MDSPFPIDSPCTLEVSGFRVRETFCLCISISVSYEGQVVERLWSDGVMISVRVSSMKMGHMVQDDTSFFNALYDFPFLVSYFFVFFVALSLYHL